jgi:hypothetical protein
MRFESLTFKSIRARPVVLKLKRPVVARIATIIDWPLTAPISSSPHRSLGFIFVSLRIAPINRHAVAHIFRHEPAEAAHGLVNAFLIGRNDLAQVLRVHAHRCPIGHQAISYRALHATIASGRVRLATEGGAKIAR